jgi:hypothetical protein
VVWGGIEPSFFENRFTSKVLRHEKTSIPFGKAFLNYIIPRLIVCKLYANDEK